MRLDLVFIDNVNLDACLKFEYIKEGNSGDKGAEIKTHIVDKVVRIEFTEASPESTAVLRSFKVNTWVSSVFMVSCLGTYSPTAVY